MVMDLNQDQMLCVQIVMLHARPQNLNYNHVMELMIAFVALALISGTTVPVVVRSIMFRNVTHAQMGFICMAPVAPPVLCVLPDRLKQLRVRRVLTQYAQHVLVVPELTVLVEHPAVSHVLLKNTVLVALLTPKHAHPLVQLGNIELLSVLQLRI